MSHRSRFARRLCLGVDAASYSSRDNVGQYDLQAMLSSVLDDAAAEAGLDRTAWQRQAQGDGELSLISPDQPEPRLIDDFVRELGATLQLRNHGRLPATRLRLRAAIDFGVAYESEFGFAGDAVIATARLLGSDGLRRALVEAPSACLAIALSAGVYQTVQSRHTSLSPDQFCRIEVAEKEFRGEAWIMVIPDRHSNTGSAVTADSSAVGAVGEAESPSAALPPGMQFDFHDKVEAEVIGIQNVYGSRGARG